MRILKRHSYFELAMHWRVSCFSLLTFFCRFWEGQEMLLKAKGAAGQALLAVVKRYLSAPATSTAVERLFSVAGLVMDDRRNKLSPVTLDKLPFVRESLLLGTCKLQY